MIKLIRALSILSLAALASCVPIDCPTCVFPVPPTASTQPVLEPVSHIKVAHVSNIFDGTAAFVGSTVAQINQPIFEGDHFFTGAGTKMEVTIETGGSVMLDANTDPNLFTSAKCFVLRLLSGKMVVNSTPNNPLCVESGSNAAGQHSSVLYESDGRSLTITVFEGQVITIRPSGVLITTGQSATLKDGRLASPPQQLSQDILNEKQSWIPRVIL
jgi:ferric-dicitrate binding protein FerR (iron transport regulator)